MRYFPKGGMCCNCAGDDKDCSVLDFSAMPVIEKFPDNTAVVRCTEHQRPERRPGQD